MALFAKDGYSNILTAVVIALILCAAATYISHWSAWLLYGAAGLLVLFILYFFRDPDRKLPADHNLIVSPADGRVVSITETDEPLYLGGKARQISIFLSALDVHVNRLPASGIIEYVKYNPGVYLMAWDHRASSMNERADFGMKHAGGVKLFFRQITGFMARRIVYHLEEGEQVKAGERFGMMKFGSRMDVLLPPEVEVEIKEGDRTIGAETVLGRIGDT